MSGQYFYGATRKPSSAAQSGTRPGPRDFHGARATGRVAKLLIGQGYGFIRLANEREIFFHRADVQEGTAFNDLRTGDAVTFELFEDPVSGARGLCVSRRTR
jgi:cold shock CspA family protein